MAKFLGLAGSKFKVRVSSICRGPPPGLNKDKELDDAHTKGDVCSNNVFRGGSHKAQFGENLYIFAAVESQSRVFC